MPLCRHIFAANTCRNVSIASPQTRDHTGDMTRVALTIILSLQIISVTELAYTANDTPLPPSKKLLITQIKKWIAKEKNIDQADVNVAALDRRLIVPQCPNNFEISFPFSSDSQQVRADCAEIAWKAFIRVSIESTDMYYVYKDNFPRGHRLQIADIELSDKYRVGHNSGLIKDSAAIKNQILKRSVSTDQLVRRQHLSRSVEVYVLKQDKLAGERLMDGDYERSMRAISEASAAQRFPERLLENALIARSLPAGYVLHERDLKQRHRILVAQETLTRGRLLSPSNARIEDFYGDLQPDAILSTSGIEYLEVIRTIQAGSPLRASDVQVASLINKGDTVNLSVTRGSLLITVSMEALESGKMGEQVVLLNPESGERVKAVVSGIGSAKGL
ncbi:MAG: flagella basal body P-ring formation protein FlgA [Cellvibrionales bacterium TMED49]|nr:flagella basal body P-ring formation protein FlgA [Porticoccaceae bacterium]OUU36851.1 MAG: flagella basal body P-ring formation protein FlgA [Cellvibrionales bacterium TMED49]